MHFTVKAEVVITPNPISRSEQKLTKKQKMELALAAEIALNSRTEFMMVGEREKSTQVGLRFHFGNIKK